MAPDEFPYLTEVAQEYVINRGSDYGAKFEFGLELILEELVQRLGIRFGNTAETSANVWLARHRS